MLAGLCLPSCAHLLASGQPAVCLADASCQQAGFAFCSCAYPVMFLQAYFSLAALRQKARLKMENSKMK
jgi:hypothetical protein